MNAGTLAFIGRDIVNLLEQQAILLPDGSFDATKLDTLEEDVALAGGIAGILRLDGVEIPDRIDAVIQLWPFITALLKMRGFQ